jgi:hypothetical protein
MRRSALMGACILRPPRISLPGCARRTGGDCSCPRRVNKNNAAMQNHFFCFCRANIWRAAAIAKQGGGADGENCVKNVSVTPSVVGMLIVSQQLDYADCLATSFSPAALCFFFSLARSLTGREPPAPRSHVSVCIILKIIRSNYHNIIYTAVLYAL